MNEELAKKPLGKLLLKLALPSIAAQIVTLLYTLVDRIYIGQMDNGVQAMAAIGLCIPVVSLVSAIAALFGRGGAPLASIAMGRDDHPEAEKILSVSFFYLTVVSLIFSVLVLLFLDPILILLGAGGESLAYAESYLGIYAVGIVFAALSVGLNFFINTQGFTTFGLMTNIFGAGLNIILDPIFIFGLNMGVTGAALATVLSQLVSCIWVLLFFASKKTLLKIRLKKMMPTLAVSKKILSLGASPFFMTSTEGILTLCFNQQLLRFGGVEAVSSMTILASMFQLLLLPMEGVAQGAQPIQSYNYGAGNYERVEKAIALTITVNMIWSVLGTLSILFWPQFFIGWFAKDPELVQFTVPLLRVYIFGCIVMGANCTYQQTYNSLGFGGFSFAFAFLRKIILLIPLIYILPLCTFIPMSKVMLVILAEPVSDLLTTVTNSVVFFGFIRKKLNMPSAVHLASA
ncbi:MAG: MATE family efflux transporter [Erysipelotrichaceae bacterium]|nr:MATE family efflux transporter [Erysipelotrichaceae bacterium]